MVGERLATALFVPPRHRTQRKNIPLWPNTRENERKTWLRPKLVEAAAMESDELRRARANAQSRHELFPVTSDAVHGQPGRILEDVEGVGLNPPRRPAPFARKPPPRQPGQPASATGSKRRRSAGQAAFAEKALAVILVGVTDRFLLDSKLRRILLPARRAGYEVDFFIELARTGSSASEGSHKWVAPPPGFQASDAGAWISEAHVRQRVEAAGGQLRYFSVGAMPNISDELARGASLKRFGAQRGPP